MTGRSSSVCHGCASWSADNYFIADALYFRGRGVAPAQVEPTAAEHQACVQGKKIKTRKTNVLGVKLASLHLQ